MGYVDCPQVTVTRQIVLNGKNKYLINGHNAQQKAVENLFQSVQLNVNNPHFLIMQGQITRVLNMRPEEILAMIEESAGTRMFEDRKAKAMSTLEKKEKKVEEIAALIDDTIEPKLNALRAERADFLEYKRTEADLERISRLCKAYEYKKAAEERDLKVEKVHESKEELSSINSVIKEARFELEKVADDILNVTKKRQKEAKSTHKIRDLEESCRESAAQMVRLQTELDFKKDALANEEKTVLARLEELEVENKRFEKLSQSIEKVEKRFKEQDEKRNKLQTDLKRNEDLLRSLETGLSGSDSSETGYVKLLKDARDRQSQAKIALQQSQMRTKSLRLEISSLETKVEQASKDSKSALIQVDKLKSEIAAIEMELSGMTTLPVSTELYAKRAELEASIATLQEELEGLKSSVNSVAFKYTIADPTFDHDKVKGVVAQLVHLDELNMDKSTALEVAAGGRLYNVVVEDEKTAATLLDKGKLTRRVTIIPLNKIQGKRIGKDKQVLAEEATKGQAKIGLSLIGYDKEVTTAMEYVFGTTFICASKEAATTIAFDRRFGHRAVTLQGDVYEPSGTLSGGSAPSSGNILLKLNRFRQLDSQIAQMQQELAAIQKKIGLVDSGRKHFVTRELELKGKQQELTSLTRQLQLNSAGQVLEKHQKLTSELESLEDETRRHLKAMSEAETEIATYEKESNELENDREGKLKALSVIYRERDH